MLFRIVFLCLAALCSTGIAQESSPAKNELSLSYIPSDALVVVGAKPASLMAKPTIQAAWKLVKEQPPFAAAKDPAAISTVQLIVLPPAVPQRADNIALKITAKSPQPIKEILQQLEFSDTPKQSYGGVDYRQTANKWFVSSPQETTLLIGFNENAVRSCLLAGEQGASNCTWASTWSAASGRDICFAATPALATKVFWPGIGNGPSGRFDMSIQNWDSCLWMVGTGNLDDGKIQLIERISSDSQAETMIKENYRAIQLVRFLVSATKQSWISQDKPESESVAKLLSRVDEALEQTTVTRNKEMVHVTTKVDRHLIDHLPTYMNNTVRAGNIAAKRGATSNSLRQLALAMHNYESAYKRFPAASQIGPNNQPRSWRVSVLPYLDHAKLYEEYRQDQAWDSEENKRLLTKMPEVFGTNKQGLTNLSVIVSKHRQPNGAIFQNEPMPSGPSLANITDGTSNTILIVETQPERPWTKPEDVDYDPRGGLPELRGIEPGGFSAALADGSVRFFPSTLKHEQIRALISANGGEIVEVDAIGSAPR